MLLVDSTDPTQQAIDKTAKDAEFNLAPVPYHTHNGTDSPLINFPAIPNFPRIACLVVFGSDTSVEVGDGVSAIPIPENMDGMALNTALANVYTPGTTGTMTVQIRRSREGTDADMLSSKISLVTGTIYYASSSEINSTNRNVATGDKIYVDVDTIHTTPAMGLSVALTFE